MNFEHSLKILKQVIDLHLIPSFIFEALDFGLGDTCEGYILDRFLDIFLPF